MKIDHFSPATQEGLRLWAKQALDDELALDGTAAEHWAWVYFQLQVSPDRREWFPKGKWATLELIEERLLKEASKELAHIA